MLFMAELMAGVPSLNSDEVLKRASKRYQETENRINEKIKSFNTVSTMAETLRDIEELSKTDRDRAEAIATGDSLINQLALFIFSAEALGDTERQATAQDIIGNFYYKLRLKKKATQLIDKYLRELRKEQRKDLATAKGVKKVPLTMDDLISELDKVGIVIRENILTHEIEYIVPPQIKKAWNLNQEHIANDISIYLKDIINNSLEYSKTNKNEIDDYLTVIGHGNTYNPLQELLNSITWDGSDRWGQLFNVMGLTDELSKTLVKKWLYQTIAQALYNGTSKYKYFGADGILVLQGSIRVGKSQFVRLLDPFRDTEDETKYINQGKYNGFDKDTQIQITKGLITELAELDRTINLERISNATDFKAFIDAPIDEYRLPYERKSEKHPRRTGFIGTVNPEEFLVDPTGNRKYYTVRIEKIDLESFRDFAIAQLWKQASIELAEYQDTHGKGWQSIFRLTDEEFVALNKNNAIYEKPLPGEDTLKDLIAQAEADSNSYEWLYKTVAQIKMNWSILTRYTDSQLRKALQKMSKQDNCKVDYKRSNGSFYLFPVYKGTSTGLN